MLETIQLRDKTTGTILLRPCLEIMMFSEVSLKDGAGDYFQTFQIIHSFFKNRLKFYKTNDMKRAKGLTCEPEQQIKLVLDDAKATNVNFLVVQQHSGDTADDYGLPSFSLFSEREKIGIKKIKEHVLFRVCISPELAGIVPQMLLKAIEYFPLSSGYCIYSNYYNVGNLQCIDYIEQQNAYWLKRFPGLNHGNPLQFLPYGTDGLLQVGWLTMLGEKYVDKLEPISAWIGSLPKEIETIAVPGKKRLIVKAGPQPELGDSNRGSELLLYKSVGKALANFRLSDSLLSTVSIDGLPDEDVREWMLRFFGDDTD